MLKEQHQRELKELEERLLQQVQPVGKKKTEKKSPGEEEDMTQKRGPVLEERLLQQVKSVNRSTAEQQHHARNSTVMPANWNKYTDDTYNRNYYVNEKVDQNFFLFLESWIVFTLKLKLKLSLLLFSSSLLLFFSSSLLLFFSSPLLLFSSSSLLSLLFFSFFLLLGRSNTMDTTTRSYRWFSCGG